MHFYFCSVVNLLQLLIYPCNGIACIFRGFESIFRWKFIAINIFFYIISLIIDLCPLNWSNFNFFPSIFHIRTEWNTKFPIYRKYENKHETITKVHFTLDVRKMEKPLIFNVHVEGWQWEERDEIVKILDTQLSVDSCITNDIQRTTATSAGKFWISSLLTFLFYVHYFTRSYVISSEKKGWKVSISVDFWVLFIRIVEVVAGERWVD